MTEVDDVRETRPDYDDVAETIRSGAVGPVAVVIVLPPDRIVLTDLQRLELTRPVRAGTTPQRLAQRAVIVLAAATKSLQRAPGRETGISSTNPKMTVTG
jgi:hypothetical protein